MIVNLELFCNGGGFQLTGAVRQVEYSGANYRIRIKCSTSNELVGSHKESMYSRLAYV